MSKSEISRIEDEIAAGRMTAAQVFTRMRTLASSGGPEFTDWARAALLFVLWHHQGGNSEVGQPIRFALGMGRFESLSDWQIEQAKRWAALDSEGRAELTLSASGAAITKAIWGADRMPASEHPLLKPFADPETNALFVEALDNAKATATTYANTPEEFDAAIDAAIEYEAGRQAAEEPYEDPSAIFGDPRA